MAMPHNAHVNQKTTLNEEVKAKLVVLCGGLHNSRMLLWARNWLVEQKDSGPLISTSNNFGVSLTVCWLFVYVG